VYEISYSKPAERYFKKIKDKNLLDVFKKAIDKLKVDPYIGEQKRGDLSGLSGFRRR